MAESTHPTSLFEPGHNCWRVEPAERAAFLVDAEAYFSAFVAAAQQAKHSILVTGWDFHSRTVLAWDEHSGKPVIELGGFLNELVKHRRSLQIHVLIWDYPMIFGLDREWAPIYGLGWKPRRRVHVRYDNTHPVGGSHHQKLVVVDDAVAFCGGIDLTCRRWDTCAHAADEPRRRAAGTPYPPFHDMMMAVEGPAAAALGDLVRERWTRATGQRVLPPPRMKNSPWPKHVTAVLADVEVAISRTEQQVEGRAAIREVEDLYIDMVNSARRCIYIENQYFTADRIGKALLARLAEDDGPEIIVILRRLSHGWLEELTMESLRTRLIEKLRAADRHGRLHVFYPFVQGLKEGTCIDVHSKMMILDEDVVRIGSANLANRSMGLDTECDLTIEAAGREAVREAIRTLRSNLLAEHLGAEPQAVARAIESAGSINGAINLLRKDERTLQPLDDLPQVSDAVLDIASVADPERPVDLAQLTQIFNSDVKPQESRPAWGKLAAFAAGILAMPGTLAATVFGKELQVALNDPGKINYWLIGVVVALMVIATFAVRRWLNASVAQAGQTSSASSASAPRVGSVSVG